MKKNEIKVGGHYRAKVSGNLVTVRVDGIEDRPMGFGKAHTAYHVINLSTGRKTTFRSAAKFRSAADLKRDTQQAVNASGPHTPETEDEVRASFELKEGEQRSDPTLRSITVSNDSAEPSNATAAEAPTPTGVVPRTGGLAARLRSIPTAPVDTAPHLIVEARAGTGKTTTLIEGLKQLLGVPTSIVPSPQQQAVWDAICLSRGKVRTIGFVAFNKSIASELQARVPSGVEAKTMHGLGFGAVRKAFPGVDVKEDRVKTIIAELLGKSVQEMRKDDPVLVRAVCDLVGLCKMNLTRPSHSTMSFPEDRANPLVPTGPATFTDDWNEVLSDLADRHEVETNGCWSRVVDLVPRLLDRCKDVGRDRTIDYDDMVWLPVVLNLPVFRFDFLLVDEAQDLNRCQQELAKKAGKRLILCGDPKQAIYGFAGADSKSMDRMGKELDAPICDRCGGVGKLLYQPMKDNVQLGGKKWGKCPKCKGIEKLGRGCVVLPLTVTRRCPKTVVAEANRYVKDFQALESAGEGVVRTMKYPVQPGKARGETVTIPDAETYLPDVRDGDMIVCRSNAPLTKQCLKFLRLGRRAKIQGRSVGQGIISLVHKMKATSVPDLIAKLDGWVRDETARENAKASPDEGKIEKLVDRHASAMCFVEGASSVDDVVRKIESVFSDDADKTAPVLLSSIHRAKGLEARRVFYLTPAVVPGRRRMPAWQREEEDNLAYVAITRAIEELVYVV